MPESDPEGLVSSGGVDQDDLFQREWMFGFDPTELASREPTAGVALQVFDVGSGTCAGFFQRLHWAVAVPAAHNLVSLSEGFIERAWQPTATDWARITPASIKEMGLNLQNGTRCPSSFDLPRGH